MHDIYICNTDSCNMNINLQGLLGALEKPKSNPVGKVSFHSDKVNENEIISEHDKRWNSLVNHIASLSRRHSLAISKHFCGMTNPIKGRAIKLSADTLPAYQSLAWLLK